jgi:hypothetical protein
MNVLNKVISGLDDVYLVHTRNFVVNEVESDVVYLQNKTIGKNHVQGVPSYKYRAWYKAYTRIEIGHLVTPKTDPGNYVIEKTGDITVYAGESVVLKPGFHAHNGSTFHAFIKRDCIRPPANVPVNTSFQEPENSTFTESILADKTNYSTEGSNAEDINDTGEDLEHLNVAKNAALFEENLPRKQQQTATIRLFAVRNDDEL